MRTIILTIGTLIANRLDSLHWGEWVVVGVLGLLAIIGDILATDSLDIIQRNKTDDDLD